jgi:hypothetical protein
LNVLIIDIAFFRVKNIEAITSISQADVVKPEPALSVGYGGKCVIFILELVRAMGMAFDNDIQEGPEDLLAIGDVLKHHGPVQEVPGYPDTLCPDLFNFLPGN